VEFRRHAALALDPALEGDPGQVAFEIVAPPVIDAGDLLAAALARQAQQVAAVGAAVDERVDRTIRRAGDDDRDLTDRRRDPVAGVRYLAGKAQIAPARALEEALLFEPVLLGIGIEPERHLADPVRRPQHAGVQIDVLNGHWQSLAKRP